MRTTLPGRCEGDAAGVVVGDVVGDGVGDGVATLGISGAPAVDERPGTPHAERTARHTKTAARRQRRSAMSVTPRRGLDIWSRTALGESLGTTLAALFGPSSSRRAGS